MVFAFHILFVLMISAVLTAIFAVGFRGHTRVSTLVPFFILLFLSTWATGIWIIPIGPALGGVFWLSFLFIGLLYSLLLASLFPPAQKPRTLKEKARQAEKEKETLVMLNSFFWILVFGLILAIIFRYVVLHQPPL